MTKTTFSRVVTRALPLLLLSSFLPGCLSSEKQVQDALAKNPELVFKAIEDNPEKFLEVLNRAVRKAQELQAENRSQSMEKQIEAELKSPKKPSLSSERTLSGDAGGEIVVVEYGDFQCPACAVGYQNFKSFKEKHKDEMQFIFKHMPLDFHSQAMDAAIAYELIRMDSKEKALKFYQEAFAEPGRLRTEKDLESIVKKVGYDWKTLKKSKRLEDAQKIIQADMDEFQKFGFTGTPVFIVNGVTLPGAQPTAMFEKVRALTSTVR